MSEKNYDCSCWNEYPNTMHSINGRTHKPYQSGRWKCVDCYEYVGKSEYGATHCKRKEPELEKRVATTKKSNLIRGDINADDRL